MALLRNNSTNGREPVLSPRGLTSPQALTRQTTTGPEPVRPLANFPPSIWADRFISFSLDNTVRSISDPLRQQQTPEVEIASVQRPIPPNPMAVNSDNNQWTKHFLNSSPHAALDSQQLIFQFVEALGPLKLFHDLLVISILVSVWTSELVSKYNDHKAELIAQTLEAYAKAVEESKEAVRSLIIDTTIDATTKLSLIYSVHRLGLSYLYSEEIDAQLDKLFKELDLKDYEEVDLYTISVQFQVFRHHGYRLSSDVFNKFKDNSTSKFKEYVTSDVKEGRTSYRLSVVERYGISDLDAINRWEIGAVDQLPEYIKPFYIILLNEYDELEKECTNEGRAYNVHASKQAFQEIARGYLEEAEWLHKGYVATFPEYMRNGLITSAYNVISKSALVGMGAIANEEALAWYETHPKILKASELISRLQDDVMTFQFERKRGQSATGVDAYIKEYNVSEEVAIKEIKKIIENAWKDINEGCLKPTAVSMALLTPILNLARMIDVVYKFDDGFTFPGKTLKDYITLLFVTPAPTFTITNR
ncbi:hypothetical protein L6452_08852 [Arctium lappa]|uniref:Uncharacterized protein n=1 Tax=Arctium lappa TaxID=4217 RepID=A0ACB9DIF7_ARCLA|nr:hypothetical protein L6452_08852 [Arctium lappa]